jgi:murein L,D-transpeptidase YcbB/YkuD
MNRHRIARLMAVALALAGCSNAGGPAFSSIAVSRLSQEAIRDLPAVIRTRLSARTVPLIGALTDREQTLLRSLYGQPGRALWTDASGRPTGNVRDALSLFEGSAADGLDPGDYGTQGLRQRERELSAAGRSVSQDDLAEFDLAMSAAALRYLSHLHFGRVDPRTLGLQLHVPTDGHDLADVLRTALETRRLTQSAAELLPSLGQYLTLRDALQHYRTLAVDGRVPPAPVFAGTVRPGDVVSATALRDVAHRLIAFGDLEANADALERTMYGGAVVDGVRRFQSRHGLEPDGVIGRQTHDALAVPISWRVRQIEMALERLRWLPDLTHERVIALNIPMFRLWAWDASRPDGAPAFTTRAIVGRALRTQTPVFVEPLREVIFRPSWNVPRSILVSEILPQVRQDPAYLDSHAMDIVRGPGEDTRPVPPSEENLELLRTGALRLRQRPGPRNALGLAKFVFPNSSNVYLHGTPAQELFSKARRDFSHGCVRVEDPVSLAEWVLSGQLGWTRDAIVAAMSGQTSRSVTLDAPVQVVLFYITAAVLPEDGTIHFAEDIYRHDAALDRALSRRRR